LFAPWIVRALFTVKKNGGANRGSSPIGANFGVNFFPRGKILSPWPGLKMGLRIQSNCYMCIYYSDNAYVGLGYIHSVSSKEEKNTIKHTTWAIRCGEILYGAGVVFSFQLQDCFILSVIATLLKSFNIRHLCNSIFINYNAQIPIL
jgi:hypothetical protein